MPSYEYCALLGSVVETCGQRSGAFSAAHQEAIITHLCSGHSRSRRSQESPCSLAQHLTSGDAAAGSGAIHTLAISLYSKAAQRRWMGWIEIESGDVVLARRLSTAHKGHGLSTGADSGPIACVYRLDGVHSLPG